MDVIPTLTNQEMKYVNPPKEDAGLNAGDTDNHQDDEGFKFEEKKTDHMIEETKGSDQDLPSEAMPPCQYQVIPPQELFKPDWIQIPVKPVIRNQKQTSSFSYSHSSTYGPKFENQNAIPRLFWFQKTASPYEVLREIITQFSFVQSDDAGTHDEQAHFEENWKVLIEYLNDPEKAKQVLDLSEFD